MTRKILTNTAIAAGLAASYELLRYANSGDFGGWSGIVAACLGLLIANLKTFIAEATKEP